MLASTRFALGLSLGLRLRRFLHALLRLGVAGFGVCLRTGGQCLLLCPHMGRRRRLGDPGTAIPGEFRAKG